MRIWHPKKLVLSVILLGIFKLSLAACTQTLSSGANVASAVSAAASGSTICLNAGSYPAFNASIAKSSLTTITATPGVSPSQVTISSVDVGSSQNLAFVGMTIGTGTSVVSVPGGAAAVHIQFRNNRFTGPLCIYTPQNVNQDTLIDGNSFNNVGQSCTEGRLGVRGYNNTTTNGVVISNNVFSGSGPSDGIQINGSAYGTVIGPGNEFYGIKQSGCGTVHCDPIQFYGATRTTITGNYFHGNSTGIMTPDGNGTPSTITNNIFVTDGEYPDQIVCGGGNGDVITHNTFANGARIRFGANAGACTGQLVRDNIITGGFYLVGQTLSNAGTVDHNLVGNATIGTGGIQGLPTYSGGGSSPAAWTGYQLTSSSLGYRAASDGRDMGTTVFGPTSTSTPTTLVVPTNLRVVP